MPLVQPTFPGSPCPVVAPEPEARDAILARGGLSHGRQKEIIRAELGIMNLVHNWTNRSIVKQAIVNSMKRSQRDMITEQMIPIIDAIKKKQHLHTVKGQLKSLFETPSAVAEPVRCLEVNGQQIEALMTLSIGDMNAVQLKTATNESTLGKLNKFLGMLRTFMTEEMDEKLRCGRALRRTRMRMHGPRRPLAVVCAPVPWRRFTHQRRLLALSGEEVIHDRIAFAGAHWKPLRELRDKWAAEASSWIRTYTLLKRAVEAEREATRAAEARAEAMVRRGDGAGNADGPPAKRMKVVVSQKAKQHNPGSLTVKSGDTCLFIEAATNPRWSRVKMDDDGRVGLVSAGRVRAVRAKPDA